MEYICYHRDRLGSTHLRERMAEEHWSYMDAFSDALIVRGPTFAGEETLTGSLHVLDLEDAAAARRFAFEEPCYQRGAYRDVLVRRWKDALGRTMWDFTGDHDGIHYLVLGFTLREGSADLGLPTGEHVIACGHMLSDDGAHVVGAAVVLAAPDQATAAATLDRNLLEGIEVHQWAFGGRPIGE